MQSIGTKPEGKLLNLKIHIDDHPVSWRPCTSGWAELHASLHLEGKHMALTMIECPDERRHPRRQTMMTLEEAAARALYMQLHSVFGEKR